MKNAVGVYVKGDLDLRDAARRRRDAVEMEAADGLVAGGHRAFTLQHMYLN